MADTPAHIGDGQAAARPGAPVSLSVVVPVHLVQGYLRQCLDSILVPDAPNLEVIAVDDASPDHCGQILDEYAARDPRVRVRHLERNVGPGEARNTGLDMATGDYVWFVDSDDYLTPDAVSAVLERLADTRPDVLLFGHAREYWHGKVKRSSVGEVSGAEVFGCAEQPSVLTLTAAAWNRVIRRRFLVDLGLRFGAGRYEDVTVAYPVLLAAERISLLDQVCYIYRQRRRGPVTRTTSAQHFDVFDQYDRVFAFLDSLGADGERLRAPMFDQALRHMQKILERGERLHEDDAPRYFERMAQAYAAYRPAGHELPRDEQAAKKYQLIEKNDYKGYQRVLTRKPPSRTPAKAATAMFRKRKRAAVNVAKRTGLRQYYKAQLRMPIDENLAVFAAYWYRGYACNPAAIYERMRELAPDVHGVWVVKRENVKSVPKGVDYVVRGSKDFWRVMARGKYFVNNVNWTDDIVKRPGQVHVMTHHGTPLKSMGLDQMKYPASAKGMDFKLMISRADRWDFVVSSNPLSTEAWERGFPCKYEMLEVGYPRNDRLVRATDAEKADLRRKLGIPEGKKAVLYTPTHREYQRSFRPTFDIRRFARELGDEYVLLMRAHYFYKPGAGQWDPERVIDVSAHRSVEDLCIASDALLTDYSSIMFDYAVLPDRPIVLFVPDWETYQLTRGTNFDVTAFPPGAVAYDEEELLKTFRTGAPWLDESAVRARAAFRARFCPWDDGHAAERTVRRVFLGEQVPNPPEAP
ncbi:bifunctional glycosyltransferase family 2 protein/CDP-glycerol:glycerophosphate glycerophosphotransferase [Actinomadura sp. NBRC 104425]|uniref:bifunctional glycosyltransferase/CDP-glycerol:glycerophosphate glycerophosphotransferase n=1 Tax=Actinomadura sp. NBRC 104425 TaxID=3032204 RepID=UPI0025576F39|nr:bifunctional glycosyltransferase family 2 protein/CDP-glycerol:glycerophosphate glycerophosphotransferase [Actinomadura sp. NBRC 104425]